MVSWFKLQYISEWLVLFLCLDIYVTYSSYVCRTHSILWFLFNWESPVAAVRIMTFIVSCFVQQTTQNGFVLTETKLQQQATVLSHRKTNLFSNHDFTQGKTNDDILPMGMLPFFCFVLFFSQINTEKFKMKNVSHWIAESVEQNLMVNQIPLPKKTVQII